MATPIDESGQGIDEATLERFARRLIDAGVDGLFPGSSIGEFSSLAEADHESVVRTVVDAADGETTVLAGCCGTSLEAVRTKLGAAADAGADAGVVVAPYYLDTTQRGLERFFTVVADDSPLPLLLYNIPGLTGNEIATDTVAALADHDAIVGLKDTSGDLVYQHRVIEATPAGFAVFNGTTAIAGSSLDVGVDGLIAGPANVFPEAMCALYDAHTRGDTRTVARLTRDLVLPVVSAYEDVPTAAAIKQLAKLDGTDLGEPLPPLASLSKADVTRLRDCYTAVSERLDARPVK